MEIKYKVKGTFMHESFFESIAFKLLDNLWNTALCIPSKSFQMLFQLLSFELHALESPQTSHQNNRTPQAHF
jgi:hypothetical protein